MQNEITQKDIDSLKTDIENLKNFITTHIHNGAGSERIQLFDIFKLFETVSAVPTNNNPRSIFDQIKYYKSGSTNRLYMYDSVNGAWHYVLLT